MNTSSSVSVWAPLLLAVTRPCPFDMFFFYFHFSAFSVNALFTLECSNLVVTDRIINTVFPPEGLCLGSGSMSFYDSTEWSFSMMKSLLLLIEQVLHSCFFTFGECSYVNTHVTSFVNYFSVTMTHMSVTVSDRTLRIGPSSTAGTILRVIPYHLFLLCLATCSRKVLTWHKIQKWNELLMHKRNVFSIL